GSIVTPVSIDSRSSREGRADFDEADGACGRHFFCEPAIMDAKDILEAVLKFLKIIFSWPVIFLVIFMTFRREIRGVFPELARRLRKAPGGWEFGAQEKALQDALERGAEKLKDDPAEFIDFAKNQVKKLAQSRESAPIPQGALEGQSILWVDDKPLNNSYEASFFKSLGARIDLALSTNEALDLLSKKQYDLIISDIHRVEHGVSNTKAGYEFLEALKDGEIEVPLIFYTSVKKTLDRARASGAVGVANRSSDLTKLVLKVTRGELDK